MVQNKFWGDESESSSSDPSSSESDTPANNTAAQAGRAPAKRWAEESSSDDDDQPQKRVVQNTSDKRFDQMLDAIKKMNQHLKIDDFAALGTDFDTVQKMYEKIQKLTDFESLPPSQPPNRQFVQMLVRLEQFIEDHHEKQKESKSGGKKLLNENRQRSFNTLRAKVRKRIRDDYQAMVDDAKENPDNYIDKEDESAAEGDSEDSSSSSESGSSSSESGSSDSDDNSDSSSSSGSSSSGSSSSGSSSSDSDADSDGGSSSSSNEDDEDAAREKKMLRWVITPERQAKLDVKAEKVKAQAKGKDTTTKKEKRPKEKLLPGKDKKLEDKPAEKKKEEYTPEELRKKVTEIAGQRGRKGFDRKQYAEKLQELMEHAKKIGPLPQLHIYCSLVSADFDGSGQAFDAMKISLWNEAIDKVTQMLPLIEESHEAHKSGESPADTGEDEDVGTSHPRMQELFVHFIEQLDDELYKALQFTIDVYGSEYNEILANSPKFLIILRCALKFFEKTEQSVPLGTLALRVIEQVHYKPDILNKHFYEAIQTSMVPEEEKEDWVWPEDSRAHIAKLCQYVHQRKCEDPESLADQPRMQKRASLCQAYHLALHDHFHEARDMLLLGNLWDKAMESEVHTQILYHRVVAQIGLCAFRIGKMQEAHSFLAELCMHNKARVLLAQGLDFNKNNERTPQQERDERLRQLPYHMHINIEIMESAHHICAMLLEVPNLAMQSIDPTNKRVHSKVLRRALESYDKQQFCGPPENNKEAVVTAAKALQRGEWENAWAAIDDLKLWSHLVPGQNEAGEEMKEQLKNKMKEMVKEKIKETALRTYLFAYASIYDAFHLDRLKVMFDLPAHGRGSVHSIVSKMMIKEEITAFWHADEQESDQPKYYILMQHSEPTPLQRLALSLADKGAQAVDNNERLVTQKTGDFGFKDAAPARGGRWDASGQSAALRRGKGGQGKGAMAGFMGGRGGFGRGGKGGKGFPATGGGIVRDRGWGAARDIVRRRAA